MLLKLPKPLFYWILIASSLVLTGCPLQDLKSSDEDSIEQTVNENAPNAPKITMDLPVTLSNVVTLGGQSNVQKISSRTSDADLCSQYIDNSANPMVDGYSLAKYLVGLSQSQSCFADFLIGNVLLSAPYTVGQGLIEIPQDATDPDAPSHVQVEQSGDTYQVWLYFAAQRDALDKALDKMMYLTWTTVGSDTTGQFYWVRLSDPSNSEAPANLRVDFERHADSAANKIFLDFGSNGPFDGFRIDVSRQGNDSAAKYYAKGLLEFVAQPADNLPDSEDYELPHLAVNAVLNADGAGAAYWEIGNFAMDQRVPDANNPGSYTLSLGSYYMDIISTSYFNSTGEITWITRGMNNGRYINTSGTNTRFGADAWLTCMESDTPDCDGDPNNSTVWKGLNLPGYFTDTCTDVDGAECTDFVQLYYDIGSFDPFLGTVTNSLAADEPVDSRNADLDAMVKLEHSYADGETVDVLFTTPASQ